MSNSLGNTPGALIARRALATLLEDFPFLRLISSDFSQEQGVLNQALNVKLPTAFGAADNYHTTNGYVSSDANQVDVPLTLTRLIHKTYEFNDAERNSFNTSLIEGFARNAAHAIGMSLVNDLLALVVAANFANESVVTAVNFDRDEFTTANDKLTTRKAPLSGRVGLFNAAYAKTLGADTVIIANAGSPRDTVKTGQLGVIDGVSCHKYAQLPTNGEDLGGFLAIPEALLVATRLPAPPESPMPGSIGVVTDENTGLSIVLRQWYDPRLGREYRSYSLLTGVAKGIAAGLERIVSASST
jgi:hypothetical protein